MIAFTSFGDASLNYGDVDQQLVVTILTKFAIFIGILLFAGLAFLIALVTTLFISTNKALRNNSIESGLSVFLKGLFFILVFFITLLLSLIALFFVKSMAWWMVLGIGLSAALILAFITISALRFVLTKLIARAIVVKQVSSFLHRLSLLIGHYINK
ncbi:MAG: hypothetical protein U0T32_09030 [Chitinophagales bacterium]